MDLLLVVSEMSSEGVTLRARGERLTVESTHPLTDHQRDLIRRHKAALLILVHANAATVARAEVQALAGDDWPELAADPVKLATFARLVVEQRQIEAGTRPARFASVASCHWCGPVWVPAHLEGQTLLGCRWCMNRERGRPIPRPDPNAEENAA